MKFYYNIQNPIVLSRLNLRKNCIPTPILNDLKKRLKNIVFGGVYFGQEFCSDLAPQLSILKKMFNFCNKNRINFVYLTGPTGQKDIQKILKNLEFINKIGKKIEVVVNEWGILNIITTNYPNLVPVLGRLLIKNRRMAHFDQVPCTKSATSANLAKNILLNQKIALSRTNIDILEYANFLKKLKVNRIGLDLVRTGIDLNHIKDFKIDIYIPNAYITGGRLCKLAGAFEPQRAMYIMPSSCKQYCRDNKMIFEPNFDYRIFYKYNSIFLNYSDKYLIKFIYRNRNKINRIIYEYV